MGSHLQGVKITTIMKLSISLLVSVGASAMASPAGVGGIGGGHVGGLVGGHGGGHVVAPVHHGGDYHEQPDPFKFEYGVHDVKYTADGNYGGTVMEVSYKGEARHPDIVAHGHG